MNKFIDISELISLIGSVPAILFAIFVVIKWAPSAFESLRSKKELTQVDWLILGVCISFIGQAFDNLYWGIVWTLHYLGFPQSETWIYLGPTFNIFFRQACGIIAAYCHIRSAIMLKDMFSIVLITFIGMAIFGVFLIYNS